MKIFKCPKCGKHKFGHHTEQETFQSYSLNEDGLQPEKEEVTEYAIIKAECGNCEFELKNEDGTPITSDEQTLAWIEKHGVEE